MLATARSAGVPRNRPSNYLGKPRTGNQTGGSVTVTNNFFAFQWRPPPASPLTRPRSVIARRRRHFPFFSSVLRSDDDWPKRGRITDFLVNITYASMCVCTVIRSRQQFLQGNYKRVFVAIILFDARDLFLFPV